jgi:uncharacterized membrane protein YidH (DUF202 family)
MTVREAVLDAVCSQRDSIPLLLAVVFVMGLLLVFPLLMLESGSAGHAIAVIDAILVGLCLIVFGSAYWYCTKRAME